jgi:hypothetical protein
VEVGHDLHLKHGGRPFAPEGWHLHRIPLLLAPGSFHVFTLLLLFARRRALLVSFVYPLKLDWLSEETLPSKIEAKEMKKEKGDEMRDIHVTRCPGKAGADRPVEHEPALQRVHCVRRGALLIKYLVVVEFKYS